MGCSAANECLRRWGGDRRDIDLVLFAGVYKSDFVVEPAMATFLCRDLRINEEAAWDDPKKTFAFDIANGGLGAFDACWIASELIVSGAVANAGFEIERNQGAGV